MLTTILVMAALAGPPAEGTTTRDAGWVSGATPTAAVPKTDLPEIVGPPPLWVRLYPGHLAQPITPRIEEVEGHGPCVVIPDTATPIVATRLLHEADARGLPCQDRRQGHRPVYATRPRPAAPKPDGETRP